MYVEKLFFQVRQKNSLKSTVFVKALWRIGWRNVIPLCRTRHEFATEFTERATNLFDCQVLSLNDLKSLLTQFGCHVFGIVDRIFER